jgi:hypothetical protein
MNLAWQLDISHPNYNPFYCALSVAGNHTAFSHYQKWTHYPAGSSIHTPYGSNASLWKDTNHSQAELLYLIGILSTGGYGATDPAYNLPSNLNLRGARFDMRILANAVDLAAKTQLGILLQWSDPEANSGRGGNVNYIVRPLDGVSIDEQMGWTPAHARTGRQTSNPIWYDVSIQVAEDDPATAMREDVAGLISIRGRDDKVAANVYDESYDVSRIWDLPLLSVMLVAFCGQQTPSPEPLDRVGGGWGEFYLNKFEIWTP